MKAELFALCDAATDYQGKLNILGTFDTIWARKIPAVHPLCAVAIRLRFSKNEEGEHDVRINIVDADGEKIVPPLDTKVKIRFSGEGHTTVAANMILNIQGIKVPKYGEYSVDLSVDGKHEASLPLYVNQVPNRA